MNIVFIFTICRDFTQQKNIILLLFYFWIKWIKRRTVELIFNGMHHIKKTMVNCSPNELISPLKKKVTVCVCVCPYRDTLSTAGWKVKYRPQIFHRSSSESAKLNVYKPLVIKDTYKVVRTLHPIHPSPLHVCVCVCVNLKVNESIYILWSGMKNVWYTWTSARAFIYLIFFFFFAARCWAEMNIKLDSK